MRFGMSERLGPRVFGHDQGQPFLGREFSAEPDYSDEIAREIDDEIRRIVESAHQRARDILTENREALEITSQMLVKRETIEKEEFVALLDGQVRGGGLRPRRADDAARAPGRRRAGRGRRREGPRPLPRPGLAGGGLEARGLELPESPSRPAERISGRLAPPGRSRWPATPRSVRLAGDAIPPGSSPQLVTGRHGDSAARSQVDRRRLDAVARRRAGAGSA